MASELDGDLSETVNEPSSPNKSLLSRRTFGKGAAVLLGVGGAGFGYLWFGSQPALAVDNADEWIANSAEITTQDGSVDAITFGDPDEIADSEELDEEDNRVALVKHVVDFQSAASIACLRASSPGFL